jgi:hypothetical protein
MVGNGEKWWKNSYSQTQSSGSVTAWDS